MHEQPVLSLSTISHELKNPLTLIQSTLQLIGRHYPEVTNDPLWPQLLLDINYMSQLLSELSSLNSSQTLHYSQINIRQFLTNIVSSFSSATQIQNKELTLNFETEQKSFMGDTMKIREAFVNLIKNALEATESGDQIVIDVKSRWNRLVVTISDSGSGMDACRLDTIFEPFVTYKTGKPAKLVFTREECFIQGSPRHEMQVHVRLGADKNGKIRGIDLSTLSNTGAFGEHGPTTVDLSGTKSLSLYRMEAFRFKTEVVYTNVLSAGAYRGYGATQGIFAVESAVNELAHKLDIDPIKLREMNMVREGDLLTNYFGEVTNSCNLDKCVAKVKEMIGWDEKYPYVKTGPHTVRSVGMAMAMQGSGIGGVDVGSVQLKLNDDGFYTLMIGCSDMGTGCDTILAQMTADGLGCEFDDIIVRGVDTDQSPYDSGSYASSTTYVTGMAVVKACESMRKRICEEAAAIMGLKENEVEFDGETISENDNPEHNMTLSDLITSLQAGNGHIIEVTESHTSPVSPPPFMAGAAEIEVDLETGKITPINYVAAVDCGTVINTNLARIQAEGGLVQGLGMTLYEDMQYTKAGKMKNRNFMSYKIPTRLDMGNIKVEFESSYEETGPFGAKSIGEIVINTPAPAIADAVYNATGLRFRTLPITAEQVLMGLLDKEEA